MGQNKNRMVIRSAAMCVEMGCSKQMNLIFLVKGHTKNSCDCHFNLLKSDWRKKDIFTMEDTLKNLDESEYVEVINAAGCFFDWDEVFDKHYRRPEPGTVLINHVFNFIQTSDKKILL